MVQKIKDRHMASMRRRTEQLDAPTLDLLSDYLHDQMGMGVQHRPHDDGAGDGPVTVEEEKTTEVDDGVGVAGTPEQVQLLQEELDELQTRLAHTLEKEQFIGTRLRSYQRKLQQYQLQQQQHRQKNSTLPPPMENEVDAPVTEDPEDIENHEDQENGTTSTGTAVVPQQLCDSKDEEKYCQQQRMLEQIELSHKAFQKAIQVLQERIQHLELKQAQLQQTTDECQVVYETTQALRQQPQPQQQPPSTTAEDTDPEKGESPPCPNDHDEVLGSHPDKSTTTSSMDASSKQAL